jgi:2-keto-4-pentenoate hydratase/2-oxohepta-3-ene-1,7-dioic acid hydratase in catechol pathway
MRYRRSSAVHVGVDVDGKIAPTAFASLDEVIAGGEAAMTALRQARPGSVATADVEALSPLTGPRTMLFCGVNFESHLVENPAAKRPEEPIFFAKLPGAIIGPGDRIVRSSEKVWLDLEVEVAAVIGTPCRRVAPRNALQHVFGYTAVNDVSDRQLQFARTQLTMGKGSDTFCPMGPVIVTADEISPAALRLRSWVDDHQMQDASTAECFVSMAELIAFASNYTTLQPGDIVTSGTPGGVGHFRTPPTYISAGSTVTIEIEGIGRVSNPVVTA